MSGNSGNSYSSSSQYHSFVTNDPALIQLGLGTFSKESLKIALEQIATYEDEIGDEEFFQNYLKNGNADANTLFGQANTNNWTASRFNKSSNSYSSVSMSWSEISTLIDDFETTVEDLSIEHADKASAKAAHNAAKSWLDENINYIKHGSERCFVLEGPIFYDPQDGDTSEILTKLFFHVPGEGVDHEERTIAQKGIQVLAAVPRTATGLKYSRSKSGSQHAGIYIKPDNAIEGSLNDIAAGPLRLSYNDSLGMWESSQTILARLLTDLPAAGNQAFQLPKEDSDGYLETESESAQLYSKGSKYYTGKFTTAIAAPVSMKDGNPHMFGPNVIVDYNEKRIEKIRVVNRSEKPFTAGTLVLCTLIGSEWIAQEFSTLGEGLPTQMGTWTFSKLIANSDAFFRDAAQTSNQWTATKYENYARARWYYEWKGASGGTLLGFHNATEIMNLNQGSSDHGFTPSNGYFAASSFDIAKYLSYINVEVAAANLQTDFLNGEDLPNWWGPSFPDGYNQNLGTGDNGGPAGINNGKYFPQDPFTGQRSETPADIAVNGFYSDENFSSPILPLDYLQELLNGGGSFYDNAYTYRNEIYSNQTVVQNRGLTPSNPNRIQFSPLCAEMVIHADPKASTLTGAYDKRPDIQTTMSGAGFANGDPHMFGKMFERFSTSNVGDYLPYDYYVQSKPLTKPTGTLRIYGTESGDYEGLNVVGITSAINRFGRPGGGALNIEVFQDFGPPQFTSVTPGQSASFQGVLSILAGSPIINPGSGPQEYGFPQYGSISDNYNTFGTTALHCRIFDAWPREDTIWDTRYFAALHFNPSGQDEDGFNSVDFPVPTLNGGGFPSEGTVINSSHDLKNRNDWTLDQIRRGKLLSAGGFVYKKLTIGLDPGSVVIAKAGTSAETDTLEISTFNVKMRVLASGGAVTGVDFTPYADELGNMMNGEDLDGNAFKESYVDPDTGSQYTGFIVQFSDAVLVFQGVVRYIPKKDPGPQEHGGIKRLTTGTGGDSGRITGNVTTEFALNPNDTGQYDAYFFFHNDISHTFMFGYPATQYPGFAQYITMNLS